MNRTSVEEKRGQLSLLQFLVFALVGAIGTLTHYAVLLTLVELCGKSAVTGTACGALAGALVNFFLNHKLTFRSEQKFRKTILRFLLIAGASLALNTLLLHLVLQATDWDYRIAQLGVTALILVFNYVFSAAWAFAERE
ncbi:hypothetical protein F506_03720 [Herbaspirillum hiltneri N3]|uniref:GtrA/DPMS transmembrane domain-containing protein n=1 Tax=Herbaspirillum hiltneri N3 TaxID=1262470 RepID=A0ABN4HTM7_9BURK|nr:GtrA family protein [Herbaspirillum hiltneri]AKZ61894.1 hypothetical protein F506_03720 [Herbaspirillum hiltneri N3]